MEPDLLSVVSLRDRRAVDPGLTGAKAAALARSAAAGLPVLPGFAVLPRRLPRAEGGGVLRAAWREVSRGGTRPVVVRSSFAGEDTAASSMAGQFETVLDVRGWEEFLRAVGTVFASGEGREGAVLVQPMLRAAAGGVVFGVDPVGGRTDRVLVSAVRGGPDRLVAGSVRGALYKLTPRGRVVACPKDEPGPLRRAQLWRLARLARRTRELFDGPQDMEFGFGRDGTLWLLQSRPVTAAAPPVPRGARLRGPGPVAETFPQPLQPLEEDLWVAPMAHGLTLALDIAGAAPRRTLRTVPPVTTVDGRAAADLRLLGVAPHPHPVLDLVNPAPGFRRARAAWRVGRLRAALPGLATDLTADTDRQLAAFAPPARMPGGLLLTALAWGRSALSALHAQESLAGALLGPGNGVTGASEALAVLAEGRRRGLDDRTLLVRNPVLLSLVPPSLGDDGAVAAGLPLGTGGPSRWTGVPRGVGALPAREALRLRVRWVQEMQAVMARELAARLYADGVLDDPARLALLRWDELLECARTGTLPDGFEARAPRPWTPPLPAAFRLAEGRPVAERVRTAGGDGVGGAESAGEGAGGGTGVGTVWDGAGAVWDGAGGEPPERAVLVVRTLDPALAAVLPRLAGLVAETGSPLSHLAVLAREHGVPTVVGVPGARERFLPGTRVSVDGSAGTVEILAPRADTNTDTDTNTVAEPAVVAPTPPAPGATKETPPPAQNPPPAETVGVP
ncbi:PEP/pyruvate-binding domain-containing protein [Streptomyces albiaxialis]|uniref:PEP/pyruvate-binding domain-containing protein n=1 Tax=Streptomyces albiaxialis TaxID=329523 RepID=UPI0031DC37A0